MWQPSCWDDESGFTSQMTVIGKTVQNILSVFSVILRTKKRPSVPAAAYPEQAFCGAGTLTILFVILSVWYVFGLQTAAMLNLACLYAVSTCHVDFGLPVAAAVSL